MLKFLSKSLFLASLPLFSFSSIVLAHGDEVEGMGEEVIAPTLEEIIRSNSIKVVIIASLIIIITVILIFVLKNISDGVKKVLFSLIVVPTILATLFMAGSTIYLNFQSSSGGPVHWHADYKIYDCGREVNLVDPEGFSNKVGSSTFHEHNDDRIHVEGVVSDPSEASLGKFFGFVGGSLHEDGFELPTNSGKISRHNGDLCQDGSYGTLQAFVYQVKGKAFNQKKLDDPENYILSPEGNVPPGDCIIIEFGSVKEKTDKLCDSYKLQKQKGNLQEETHNELEENHGD